MSEIRLWNTRTRKKEPFEPIDPARLRMYVCGPTVYDRAHIGNARPVVVFDVLFRLLRHVYGEDNVVYARNFTDIDDKIIARAQEIRGEGESLEAACRRLTEETIGWFHEDMDALGALRPTHEPRATRYIPQMIEMIERLVADGCAYEAEGHVLFDVTKYPAYGRLSRRSLDDMIAGARVEVAPYKRNPMDFVLWKPSTPEQPGWESPWGRGRPGWHLECSVMSEALLGPLPFDIHGGGIDLLFPHHENEIAQSCCAAHTEVMANFWLHNGFLQVEREKMAKSLGNFITVRDLLNRKVPGEVIRFVLLSTHYRAPLDWTERKVEEAQRTLQRWHRLGAEVPLESTPPAPVVEALADDLNTPRAISELHSLANRGDIKGLRSGMALMNLRAPDLEMFHAILAAERELISNLVQEREAARRAKDFARADAIRDRLVAAGVVVRDTPQGTEWELSPDFDAGKLEAIADV